MKKALKISTLVLIAIGFVSCQKKPFIEKEPKIIDIGEKVQELLLAAAGPKDGMINIQSFKQAGSLIPQDQQPFDGYVGGTFYINKDDSKSTIVSKFNIEGFEIPYNNYPAYPAYGVQSNGSGGTVTNWMRELFGKKIRIALNGSVSYRTNVEDSSFYVPKEVIYSADFLQSKEYNANNSNTITWQTDPDNPDGMLYVGIVYEAVESNEHDVTMPDTSFIQAFLEIPDNGSYTITPDKVVDLPTNSYVSITLARGNYEVITDPVTGTETLVYAITQSSTSSTIKIIR